MIYQAKESSLQLNYGKVRYISFGMGEKPLVMIQGLNTRGIHGMAVPLAWMYRVFAKEYKVYLFDRREDLPEEITVRELAQDVANAMDTLGFQKADIFGVSQGGMIAEYLAMDRPDLVHKLVLAVTLSKSNEMVTSVIQKWIQLTEAKEYKMLIKDMAEKMYSEKYLKRYRPMLPLLTLIQTPKDEKRFLTLAKACLTCDAYEELEKIQCPVLVLGGGKDQVVGGEASLEIAEKLNCEIYMYEDLGHAAYEEAKDFNHKVYAFLNRTE